jgi:hypothetical protein
MEALFSSSAKEQLQKKYHRNNIQNGEQQSILSSDKAHTAGNG